MTRRESPLATWEANRVFLRARRDYQRHTRLVGLLRRAAKRLRDERRAA